MAITLYAKANAERFFFVRYTDKETLRTVNEFRWYLSANRATQGKNLPSMPVLKDLNIQPCTLRGYDLEAS